MRLPENRGFAGGMNAGIKRALELEPDYVLLLNNDIDRRPGVPARSLSRALASVPNLAAANPKTYFYDRAAHASTPPAAPSASGAASPEQIGRGQEDRGQFDKRGAPRLRRRHVHADPALRRSRRSACWTSSTSPTGKRPTGAGAPARRACAATTSRSRASGTRRRARSAPDARFHYLYRRNALLFVRKRGSSLQVATALAMHAVRLRAAVLPQEPDADRAARAPSCGRSSGTRAKPTERTAVSLTV